MSFPVMPTLPISMQGGIHKTPSFNTLLQKGTAGINAAVSLKPFPTWNFEWELDNIQGNESDAQSAVALFLGMFMRVNGSANLWLFTDPQDHSVTNMPFGIADGKSISFQLSRQIGGAVDIVQNVVGTPTIFLNGSLSVPASISPSGVVTITEVPGAGVVLTWTGQFQYLVRFADDVQDATRTFTTNSGVDQWSIGSIKFNSEFQPGIQNFGVISPGGLAL
jgi:hypothetical protein